MKTLAVLAIVVLAAVAVWAGIDNQNPPDLEPIAGAVDANDQPVILDELPPIENILQPDPRFQLVGITVRKYPAKMGVFGFTQACQEEFPGSRMCILEEALRTTELPDFSHLPFDSPAWIRGGADCLGWRWAGGNISVFGLAMGKHGEYNQVSCAWDRHVACCAQKGTPRPTLVAPK